MVCNIAYKPGYDNHNQSFKDNRKISSTKLSKAVLEIKTIWVIATNKMEIVHHATPYQCRSKTCNLCLSTKLQTFQVKSKNLLNKR